MIKQNAVNANVIQIVIDILLALIVFVIKATLFDAKVTGFMFFILGNTFIASSIPRIAAVKSNPP